MSVIFNCGFDGVSVQINFVSLRTAFFTFTQICHVDEVHRQSPGYENLAQLFERAVITFDRRDQMVARSQRLKHRRSRRQSGTEGGRFASAFQCRQRLLERAPVRIVAARINEFARITSVRRAFESGRKLNRRRDRASRFIDRVTGMHRQRFDLHERVSCIAHRASRIKFDASG